MFRVAVGNVPAEPPAIVGTRARLSQDFIAPGIRTAPGRAVQHRGQHAFAHIGKQVLHLQLAVDHRRKVPAFLIGLRIL